MQAVYTALDRLEKIRKIIRTTTSDRRVTDRMKIQRFQRLLGPLAFVERREARRRYLISVDEAALRAFFCAPALGIGWTKQPSPPF